MAGERFRVQRRALVKTIASGGVALLATGLFRPAGAAQPGAGSEPSAPQRGDVLVFASGERAGQPVSPADLVLGADPVVAFARSLDGRIRDKRPVILLRLDPGEIDERQRQYAVDGIVAYSAICTHQGCWVTRRVTMGEFRGNLLCPCHGSVYDPRRGAEVLDGPAPRPLATLPLALQGGVLAAAGSFIGRVGP